MQSRIVPPEDILRQLSEYKARSPVPPKLWVLTPCYDGRCFVRYFSCLLQTQDLFRQCGVNFVVEFCSNDSLVCRARNNLVARAMSDPEMTHIMFIDNDIAWKPMDLLRLLINDKDVVGGIYPLKKYHWERIIGDPANHYNSNPVQTMLQRRETSISRDGVSKEEYVQHNLLRYNVNYLSERMELVNSMTQVKHIPTGFMMIKRDVFSRMMAAFPSTKYVDDVCFLQPHENQFAFALFDCGVEGGHYLSEDWMFCHRWSKMGGEIWMDVSVALSHTGTEEFRGAIMSTLGI